MPTPLGMEGPAPKRAELPPAPLVSRRPADPARPARSKPDARRARWLGLAVSAIGLTNVVSAFSPGIRERVEAIGSLFTPGVPDVAAGAAAILGLGLLLVGRGLTHRRAIAYRVAVTALAISAAAHLAKGSLFVEAAASLLAIALLVRNQRLFGVRVCPRRTHTVAVFAPVAFGLTVLYGMGGLFLERDAITPQLTFANAFIEVLARLVGTSGPLDLPDRYIWLPTSISILGGLFLFTAATFLLAPIAEQRRSRHLDRARVRSMTQRTDGDTLDPFAMRSDKSYVFSTDRRAAIAYRYVNGVGLGSGDPVGDPMSFASAVHEFVAHCDRHGWRPAILGVRDDVLPLCAHVGLRSHYLGDEALIEVASFTLDGRAMRPVRQARQRTANFGLTTEIHREGDLSHHLRHELRALSVRARGGAPERGFSMALDSLLTGRDRECVVVITREADGSLLGFQRYVPCLDGRGLSLDAMRREKRGPNGINERMIVDVVEWAREHAVDVVSLNFAFFRAWLDEGARLSRLQSLEAWFVRRANPYFQIESLLRFNAKFHPRWVARHLAYRSIGELGQVGLAAMSAEAFLPFSRGTVDEPDPAVA